MLFGFNLNQLFAFPFEDDQARKYFLIGCLVYLAGFIIPILPWLIFTGYNAILMRQVLNGEKPHLVPWENWEALLKDGARLFGIRFIYTSPLFILLVPLFMMFFASPFIPFLFQNGNRQEVGTAYFLFSLAMTGAGLLMMPLSLVISFIVPAAEVHMVAKDEFAAGFQIKEWWPIFKKNWGGFLVALAIMYGLVMAMSLVMQVLFFTIVLACLFPLFMPVIAMYIGVVQYVAFAQAYKEGKEKLYLEAAAV